MNDQQAQPFRVFAAFASLTRPLVPVAIVASLFSSAAMAFAPEAFAALGACLGGFAIFQIVRRINRRGDPRYARRPIDAA